MRFDPRAVVAVLGAWLVFTSPAGAQTMGLLGVETEAQRAAPEPAPQYHVQTEAQLDAIMKKPGYWKRYISGSESLTGAEARFHERKREVDSWGTWALDYASGTISTLASPGDIAPWTFRNVTLREYHRAYDEYIGYMHQYGYLDPAVLKKRREWLKKKGY